MKLNKRSHTNDFHQNTKRYTLSHHDRSLKEKTTDLTHGGFHQNTNRYARYCHNDKVPRPPKEKQTINKQNNQTLTNWFCHLMNELIN